MASMVFVLTLFRFPFLGSKVHAANAMCLLAGMILGRRRGGIAAGIGSALYDFLMGGYDPIQCVISFVSKYAMAAVCAIILERGKSENPKYSRMLAGSISGSLTYVVLYMLKTYIYQRLIYGFPHDTVYLTMLSKLPASLINALFAVIVAPVTCKALLPSIRKIRF